ncbi:MAG: electron transfer flavoprotein, partial [Deltaproteobacteria bacterium]|nr:electron transfer flavoprotein [Deltaproteobacteria bacterium]
METVLIPPANAYFLGIPTIVFSYIITMRAVPLLKAAPDNRWNRFGERIGSLIKIWLFQYRQPRYMVAGVLHIIIFAGFLILSIRSTSLVIIGISENFVFPGLGGALGTVYSLFKDYAATMVLVACVIAMVRRGIVKPERYAVPERYGKDHTMEAVFVLCLISTLMISESLFEASAAAAQTQKGLHAEFIAPLSLAWFFKILMGNAAVGTLQTLHLATYYIHDVTFFFFLCFLPLGKHFHVITSIFNVFFMRMDRGNVKPVRHGVKDEELDDLASFGVKKLEDFTWKHLLDFYSCADCGRCSEKCPAN